MCIKSRAVLAVLAVLVAGMSAGAAHAGFVTAIQSNVGVPLQFKFSGGTTELNTWGGTDETTWGVGKLTQVIDTNSASPIWNAGDDNEEITFMLYGIADAQVSGTPPNVNIWNVGAVGGDANGFIHVDFYIDSFAASDTDFTVDGPADRTAFDKSGDWTDSSLLMEWVLDPGTTGDEGDGGFDESTATLFQQVNSSALPAQGNGQFYASCVSGNMICNLLDTNSFLTLVGGRSDFEGEFTLEAGGRGLWAGDINDPVEAIAQEIPEPTMTAMFGLGILAIAGLCRRRIKSTQ